MLNAFMQIANAHGESKQSGFTHWIEIQSWEWEVDAESSWTKGGGASVGKPNPGKMNWEHYWDKSSNILLNYICGGASFTEIQLKMCKTTGAERPVPYFEVLMRDAFITKVSQSAAEDGNVLQKVEMVFKSISINYYQQGDSQKSPGLLTFANNWSWDVIEGKAMSESVRPVPFPRG